jgi:hypothetical protein
MKPKTTPCQATVALDRLMNGIANAIRAKKKYGSKKMLSGWCQF